MKKLATCILLLSANVSAANAQSVMLNCVGTYHNYSDGTVVNFPPAAAVMDYSSHMFTYQFIEIPITRATDTKLTLEASALGNNRQYLKIFGTIDRITGIGTIYWRTPEEEAKMLSGSRTGQLYAMAEFRCSAAQKQF
jgi:hypothetical protein